MNTKVRLIVMNFLEFAVWGAYLTSMGGYLAKVGLAENIGWFYSIIGMNLQSVCCKQSHIRIAKSIIISAINNDHRA